MYYAVLYNIYIYIYYYTHRDLLFRLLCKKEPNPKSETPLKSIKVGSPGQLAAVDIVGPLPELDSGNRYILVVGDYFTRWVEAYAIPNQEAITVAKKLTNEFFFRFSPPEQLHSDQGRQFESELVAEVCKLLGIHKTRTTAYHPQSDGMIERFNRTMLGMLATAAPDHPFDWEDHLHPLCLAHNSSVHATTGFTPFYLMFGRQVRMPLYIVYGAVLLWQKVLHSLTMLKHSANAWKMRITEFGTRLTRRQERQREFYNRKSHGEPYSVGDLVFLNSPATPRGQARKLHRRWTGPFQVVRFLRSCLPHSRHTVPKAKVDRSLRQVEALPSRHSSEEPNHASSPTIFYHPSSSSPAWYKP